MRIRRTLASAGVVGAVCGISVAFAMAHGAKAGPLHKAGMKHLLVVTVTKGFTHDSIPVARETIEMLGKKTGEWDTDFVTTDAEMQQKMTPEALKKYDAVVFANTTGPLPLPDAQGFFDYIKAGHGFAAMHSGSDTMHGDNGTVSPYVEMLGGEFLTHHGQTAVMAHIDDPSFPALKPLVKAGMKNTESLDGKDVRTASEVSGRTWRIFDEIYLMKNNDPTKVHSLLSLDKYPDDGSPDANKPGIHLLSWDKAYGSGRVFYTELGHRQEVWHDPLYQAHITGGIEFALGIAKGSTKPSPPPAVQ